MQYCTFYVNQRHFGIPMMEVQEVIRQQTLTPVPLAPNLVRGLMNLRGNLVVSIDMRRRLAMPPAEDEDSSIQIITKGTTGLVGLMVDQVGEVESLDPSAAEPPPGTAPQHIRDLMKAVFALEGGLLTILDGERILELEGERHEGVREGPREFA
jgi:purine-binding chemotaxis protein CheW